MKTSDQIIISDRVAKLNAAGIAAGIDVSSDTLNIRLDSDTFAVVSARKVGEESLEHQLNTLSAELSCAATQLKSNVGTPPKNPNGYVTTDDIINELVKQGYEFRRSVEREVQGEPSYVMGCLVRVNKETAVSHKLVTIRVPREKHTHDWMPTLVDHAIRLVNRDGKPMRTKAYMAEQPPTPPRPPKGHIEHRCDSAVLEDVSATLEHTKDATWQSTLSVIFQGVIATMLVLFMFLGVPA